MSGMQRRTFLGALAGLIAAPAVVKAAGIMPVSVERIPRLWGDGIHDDTEALQWLIDDAARRARPIVMPNGIYTVNGGLVIPSRLPRLSWSHSVLTRTKPSPLDMITVEPSNEGHNRYFQMMTISRWPDAVHDDECLLRAGIRRNTP